MSHIKSAQHVTAIQDGSHTSYQHKHHLLCCLHSLTLSYGKESFKGTQREGTWLEVTCFPIATQNCTETGFWEASGMPKGSASMAQHVHACQAHSKKRARACHHVPASRIRTIIHQTGNSGCSSSSCRA